MLYGMEQSTKLAGILLRIGIEQMGSQTYQGTGILFLYRLLRTSLCLYNQGQRSLGDLTQLF